VFEAVHRAGQHRKRGARRSHHPSTKHHSPGAVWRPAVPRPLSPDDLRQLLLRRTGLLPQLYGQLQQVSERFRGRADTHRGGVEDHLYRGAGLGGLCSDLSGGGFVVVQEKTKESGTAGREDSSRSSRGGGSCSRCDPTRGRVSCDDSSSAIDRGSSGGDRWNIT
jgi:hypothetical protein